MSSKIESELVKATSIKKKSNEKPEKYVGRLVRAGADLDDDKWKALSAEAQTFVNAAAKAINDKQPLPPFPDAEEDAPDEKPEKAEKPKKDNKSETPKKEEKTETPADDKPKKKRGGNHFLRTLIVKNPDITKDDAFKQLSDAGYELSANTVEATLYDTKRTLLVIAEVEAESKK